MVAHGLDLRNDTVPLRTETGTYSTELYTTAVVDFIRAHAPTSKTQNVARVTPVQCKNMSLRQDWSAGGRSIAVTPANSVAACCQICAHNSARANGSCVAFSFHSDSCYLKNSTVGSHVKAGVVSGLLPGRRWPPLGPPPPPTPAPPNPAPPSPPPVPGGPGAPLFLYTAYQAVHTPLQAPPEYVARCPRVAQPQRKLLCGMMHAVGMMHVVAPVVGHTDS
jgi:hypothetical protein